jgi:hypothetical protein
MRGLCTDKQSAGSRRESTIRTMEEATTEAEKHASLCEALAALLAETRDKLEWARAVAAERASETAAAAAADAAEGLQLEEQAAAMSLGRRRH